jgi:outer membrane lipoprotein-sorting protein
MFGNSACIHGGNRTDRPPDKEWQTVKAFPMKRSLMVLAALAFWAGAQAQTALPTQKMQASQAAATTDQLAQVQTWLRGVTTLTADFLQQSSTGKSARGKLMLARPGKIRFEYEPSVPMLIVATGNWMSVVDYGNAQVQRWPIKDTPLSILLDPDQDIRKLAKIAVGPGAMPGFITVEAQDARRPQFGKISLYFQPQAGSPGGVVLNSWQVLDAQGNTTFVQLSNVRLNTKIASTVFTFRDPRARSQGGKGG